jgi:hypothetical protein
LDGPVKYYRTLLPNGGTDPKYARNALFGFLVNAAYLNLYVNGSEKNYSILVHTSGKKADHKTDWNTMHAALMVLVEQPEPKFEAYTRYIWELCRERYPDANADNLTRYVLSNISRHAIIILNSERDWKDNSSAATHPSSLFTIIIGGNIVSRGVTLNNLISMFFTRDVKHKIQQDTYIQRARMFGSRGDYLRFFELTIPSALYLDWHRCFVFHRLALAAIKEGLGSLVWLGDQRIAPVAGASIDRSTVDLNRGEMSFSLFDYDDKIETVCGAPGSSVDRLEALAKTVGNVALPDYLRRYIARMSPRGTKSLVVHPPLDIGGYSPADDLDKARVIRKRGFLGKNQLNPARFPDALHHVLVIHNGGAKARVFYKFVGNIQFIRNTANDPGI